MKLTCHVLYIMAEIIRYSARI